MTQNGLARRLKNFGITPKNIGPKHDRAKGYELETFADVFARYIPGFQSVHPPQLSIINDLDENQSVHQKNGCTVEKSRNASKFKGWTDGTDGNPLNDACAQTGGDKHLRRIEL